MPKPKSKIEPITGIPHADKLTVQKSLPLFALWQSDLTLAEFKILDTYLSRIDSHRPDRRTVVFEKGELETLLGVQKINKKDLETRLKHLMEQVVKLDDRGSKKGFRMVSLFEEAIAEQDDSGFWQIKLECTQKAMMYFFNIENLGYLRYKLRCITALTSRYTYIMFTYLEHNRFRKSWEVDLDELKSILDCDKDEFYREFKRFNERILKRVHREMHEKTECKYSYAPIKKGRSVVAVRFTVETLQLPDPALDDQIPGQLSLDDALPDEMWVGMLRNMFNDTQIDRIRSVLSSVPIHKLPEDPEVEGLEARQYLYMRIQYAKLRDKMNSDKIRDPLAYLCKMIAADA